MRRAFIVVASFALSLSLTACASSRQPLMVPVLVPDETSNGAPLARNALDEQCNAEGNNLFARRIDPPGRLTPRECVLRNVYRAGEAGRFTDVGNYADQLQGHYYLRSGRQQRFMDNGAAVTFIGALGAGLSGNVGVATQRAWLGVAFLPVLTTNVNANEPTRDLFHAGALGLGLVSRRYDAMHNSLTTLTAVENSAYSTPPEDCAAIATATQTVSAWAQGDDRTAILPEAQRLLTGCRGVWADYQHTQLTLSALGALRQHWASDFSRDVYALDRLLMYKDRQFRFSPAETIGAMAAAPFRTLDTFLSGQDTTQALKTMQTVMAFENMNIALTQMQLPTRRDVTAPITLLNAAASARGGAQTRAARQPSLSAVSGVLSTLDRTARELDVAQSRQAYRSQLLSDFYASASARHLEFSFSATSGVVSVDLRATPSTPPAASAQSEPEPATPAQ